MCISCLQTRALAQASTVSGVNILFHIVKDVDECWLLDAVSYDNYYCNVIFRNSNTCHVIGFIKDEIIFINVIMLDKYFVSICKEKLRHD